MSIRTLIADDEPLALEGLEMALGGIGDVEIVARCSDGQSAVQAIRELRPDLVFLDVRMPGLTGFGVVETVGPAEMPAVIFLTAYDEFAVDAFRVNAIDYLLKPIDNEVLRDSVDRARRRIVEADIASRAEQLRELLGSVVSGYEARAAPPADDLSRVVVRSAGRVQLLDPGDIRWVEADGDYVTVHAAGKAHLVRDSMKGMEARLAPHGFQRVHRSSLVNLRCVRELVATDSGDYQIVLDDGTVLRLSRNYRDALYAALKTGA
jgi:two-component system LytT family response regulator